MYEKEFSLKVVVDGLELPVHQHEGKFYVAAPVGKKYELQVRVPWASFNRYAAVLSVDGLSVMNGKRATLADSAYVIDRAHGGVLTVPGFRLNDEEVAHFVFGAPEESYAALMDKPENIGVIAAVIYAEKCPVRETGWGDDLLGGHLTRGGGMTMGGGGLLGGGGGMKGGNFPTRSGGHDVGTGFGDRTEHKVQQVQFERGEVVARIVIEYASEESLKAAGIIKTSPLGDVSPFAAPEKKGEGCALPPGWKG
ncbi:MAG: hypothetical protein SFV17_05615 [Candidatus Obscuribacter sp.]|nr:hypothetical protein [Candidatus Obscuribacter sp.]